MEPVFLEPCLGAQMVRAVSIEEWGAFFVELAAGAEEGEAGGEGGVVEDFIAELAGKSEEGAGRFCGWWRGGTDFVHRFGWFVKERFWIGCGVVEDACLV